jgi:hypothetical protein
MFALRAFQLTRRTCQPGWIVVLLCAPDAISIALRIRSVPIRDAATAIVSMQETGRISIDSLRPGLIMQENVEPHEVHCSGPIEESGQPGATDLKQVAQWLYWKQSFLP